MHASSAVNVAEYAPLVADAGDRDLEAYLDVGRELAAGWIVLHAGCHFTSDKRQCMDAGLARTQGWVERAERLGAMLLLENLNKEPANAEVHFTGSRTRSRSGVTATTGSIFPASDSRSSPTMHIWSRKRSTAHRCTRFRSVAEVRRADWWRNGHEEHLIPGRSDFDFGEMFRRIEATGFAAIPRMLSEL